MQFFVGDSIVFMTDGFKTPRRAVIGAIGKDYILVGQEEIKIRDISGIVKTRALHYKAAGATMKIAGPGLIFLDGLNSLIRGFRPLFSTRVAIAGALIFGSGFVLPRLQTKVYYIEKGYYLRIVPADPATFWKDQDTKYLPSQK